MRNLKGSNAPTELKRGNGAQRRRFSSMTVVLILHGDPPCIRQTIQSIQEQQYSSCAVNILCLDDATSPRARRVLDELHVDTHDLPSKCSISYAKNYAIRVCEDDLVFFLDDHMMLESGSIAAAFEAFERHPDAAGVCGFYSAASTNDFNILRDIKRRTIYGKDSQERVIDLERFTTFSMGIGIVRRKVFINLSFPESLFPNHFGGEDTPALIEAVNAGHWFIYTPRIRAVHQHDLSFLDFVKKMEIEIRGRFSILYWAANRPDLRLPHLHGFLNFPYFLALLTLPCFVLVPIVPWAVLAPLALFGFEVALSLRTLAAPKAIPRRIRLLAAVYVVLSDLLSVVCQGQYLVSRYKRPYHRLGPKGFLALNRIYLSWETEKWRSVLSLQAWLAREGAIRAVEEEEEHPVAPVTVPLQSGRAVIQALSDQREEG